jgi:hypothetical protein
MQITSGAHFAYGDSPLDTLTAAPPSPAPTEAPAPAPASGVPNTPISSQTPQPFAGSVSWPAFDPGLPLAQAGANPLGPLSE